MAVRVGQSAQSLAPSHTQFYSSHQDGKCGRSRKGNLMTSPKSGMAGGANTKRMCNVDFSPKELASTKGIIKIYFI